MSGNNRQAQVFTSHEEAQRAQTDEWARLSHEQRLQLGAELHAFWVRNYFPDATRLDRVVQVAQRPPR